MKRTEMQTWRPWIGFTAPLAVVDSTLQPHTAAVLYTIIWPHQRVCDDIVHRCAVVYHRHGNRIMPQSVTGEIRKNKWLYGVKQEVAVTKALLIKHQYKFFAISAVIF